MQADHDPRRAEAALARSRREERVRPRRPLRRVETGEGGDRPSRNAPGGRDAGDARLAVDEHRAAAALTLRTAAVLGGAEAEPVAEDLEQRTAVVGDVDGTTVDDEGERAQVS